MNQILNILIILILIALIPILILLFQKYKIPIKESFSTKEPLNPILINNLISNGSFSKGYPPNQFTNQHGKHDIIIFPNNGPSSYVLRQAKNKKLDDNEEIFYKLELSLKPNSTFYIGALYFSTNNTPLSHKIIFNNEQSINLKTISEPNQQKDKDFDYRFALFKTPQSKQPIQTEILISFQFNNLSGYNYITDIGLFEIIDNNGLPITEDLRSYFNVYNPESIKPNQKIIKDLSSNGFDFTASTPENIQQNNINLINNSLTGPSAFKLQNTNMINLTSNFTFFLYVKALNLSTHENFTSTTEEEEHEEIPFHNTSNYSPIINIPGNQNNAISILLPKKYGKILINTAGTIHETQITNLSYLDTLLTLTYNGDAITLFLNDEVIYESSVPKIYFDNRPLMINPDGTFFGNLFAFAFYNKNLSFQQIKTISKYLIKIRANGKELSTMTAKMLENVASFIIQPPLFKTKDKKIDTNIPTKPDKTCNKDEKCPKVIFEDNHYYVIVPTGSQLEKDMGYSGIRDYGSNIDTAKQIFETNFPKCTVPDILDKRKYKPDLSTCPFIIMNEENPCKKYECKNIDWKTNNVKDKNCKKMIDTYCSKYAEQDSSCYCWRNENKDKPECLKWRGKFEAEDKCDFRKFPITSHPDSSNWIEKDKIPCWGCNLTAPESATNFGIRKGSGGR